MEKCETTQEYLVNKREIFMLSTASTLLYLCYHMLYEVIIMSSDQRIQVNVRLKKDTNNKLDEIVEYYQENTKFGRVYKGDVLTDIIEKSYDIMLKQKKMGKKM